MRGSVTAAAAATAADWLAAARSLALDPRAAAPRAWLATDPAVPEAPWPPRPEGLAALPSAQSPAEFHGAALKRLAAEAGADPLALAWHARWLSYLLAPDDPSCRPKVSVLIPVYNRAGMVVEAVASALEQDWPAKEVLVIDDGSTDALEAALAPFAGRVVLCRLPQNRGVAAARNEGLARATGELVQFLDSDNRLLPGALSRKVAALAHVPDALLCYARYERLDPVSKEYVVARWTDIDSPISPTRLPGAGLIIAYAFLTSTLMLARHLALAVGGFDERLRRHEDRLLFQRIGLTGAKSVAVDAALMRHGRSPDSLARQPDREGQGAQSALIFLNELLPQPQHWPLAVFVLQWCLERQQWARLNDEPPPPLKAEAERLLAWLEGFAAGHHHPELSPRPLAAEFRAKLEAEGLGATDGAFAARFRVSLDAMARARPPGPIDLALWRESHNLQLNRPAFLEIFAALSAELRQGRPWVPLATLDQRPFRSVPHRWRRGWKRIAQSARLFGERPALFLARWRG